MKAAVGDWLVVGTHTTGRRARRAQILGVRGDGLPPFTVRWIDDDRKTVVFPGPDAQIVSPERMAELDQARVRRIADVQSAISTRYR